MENDTLYETYADDLQRAKKEHRELRDGDPKMWTHLLRGCRRAMRHAYTANRGSAT